MSIIDNTDEDLEYVRAKRKQIVEHYTANGKLPADLKEVQTLLVALSDMDRATLSKKKIKVDKDVGNAQAKAMEVLAAMYTDPRSKKIGKSDDVTNTVLPELDLEIDPSTILPGETDALGKQEDYNGFMARMNGA